MIAELFTDGVLRERRDDATRTVTTYSATGTLTGTRPYTTAENAAADAAAAQAAAAAERKADRLAVRAILDTINAQLDEARAAKTTAQGVLAATAPTNVAQTWTQVKDVARAVRDTNNALIGIGQGVKDIARMLRD